LPDPYVSVIVPAKNEELFIRQSLLSLLSQDYEEERFEVIVVNDHSADGTREIVESLANEDSRIRLFDNPSDGASAARNFAILQSRGSIIVNFSGHAIASESFLRVTVSKLLSADEKVGGVGCRHETPVDEPTFAKVARLALSTYLGGIGSTYHQFAAERSTLSIAFAAYRRSVFNVVGGFDESMKQGQDLEFNVRLNEAGYGLLYTPETAVYHREVRSLGKFVRHMLLYGLARGAVTLKHPRFFSPVHLVPSLLVLMLAATTCSLVISGNVPLVLLVLWSGYALSCLASALTCIRSVKAWLIVFLAALYPVVHFSYGIGYLASLPLAASWLRSTKNGFVPRYGLSAHS
jgi:cellulose synthase/poly-beta-1,6-N-acetylglucosamine synthase-like glycosyltransferase